MPWGYFLAGNVNKSDWMTAKEMVSQLQILVHKGEDVPETTIVANWIKWYAASLKQSSAQMAEELSKERSTTFRHQKNQ